MTSFGVGAVMSTISLMMWRGVRNCPFCPGGGDLAEHVLVEITLGIAVGHVDVVELVDHVGQHPSSGHHEEGVLHVMGVGGCLVGVPRPAHRLDEGNTLSRTVSNICSCASCLNATNGERPGGP